MIQIDEDKFRALWADASLTVGQIGAEVGIAHRQARRVAARLGLPPRTRGVKGKATHIDMEAFAAMRADGFSVTTMAEVIGCSPATISQIARRSGMPSRWATRPWKGKT